ncbi:hypothetical protein K0M31_003504, partial [Melipona bicolor]
MVAPATGATHVEPRTLVLEDHIARITDATFLWREKRKFRRSCFRDFRGLNHTVGGSTVYFTFNTTADVTSAEEHQQVTVIGLEKILSPIVKDEVESLTNLPLASTGNNSRTPSTRSDTAISSRIPSPLAGSQEQQATFTPECTIKNTETIEQSETACFNGEVKSRIRCFTQLAVNSSSLIKLRQARLSFTREIDSNISQSKLDVSLVVKNRSPKLLTKQ